MLQVIVGSNIRIRGASVPLRAALMTALTLDNPDYAERKKRRQPTYGLERVLHLYTYDMGDIVTGRGFLEPLKNLLRQQGLQPEKVIEYRYADGLEMNYGPWNPEYPPRGEQAQAIEALVAANGIVKAPAGAGKTLIGMAAIHRIGRAALWVAHTNELVDQAIANAYRYMPRIGKVGSIAGGRVDWGTSGLIVAMVHALDENPKLVENLRQTVGVVLVDEVHHFPAEMFERVVSKFDARHIKGVTATDERKDRLECVMYNGIGPKLYEVDRQPLYDAGFLVKPTVEFIYTEFGGDPASQVSEFGAVDAGGEELDYRALMDELITDEQRNKLVAGKILDYAANNCQVVLSESKRHLYTLKDYVERFAKTRWGVVPRITVIHGPTEQYGWRVCPGGIKAAERMVHRGEAQRYRKNEKIRRIEVYVPLYSDAEIAVMRQTANERKPRLGAVRAGQIDILFATFQLVREGLDIPHLNVGHLATPARGDGREAANGASIEQAIGRIMRGDPRNPNKKAYWLDYVDYQVGVFKDQYYSRRKVYQRLGIPLPKKLATRTEQLDAFLGSIPW